MQIAGIILAILLVGVSMYYLNEISKTPREE